MLDGESTTFFLRSLRHVVARTRGVLSVGAVGFLYARRGRVKGKIRGACEGARSPREGAGLDDRGGTTIARRKACAVESSLTVEERTCAVDRPGTRLS
jgi:hypothetical protein